MKVKDILGGIGKQALSVVDMDKIENAVSKKLSAVVKDEETSNFVVKKLSSALKSTAKAEVKTKAAASAETGKAADAKGTAEPSKTADTADRYDNGVIKVKDNMTSEEEDNFIDSLMNIDMGSVPKTPLQTGEAALKAINNLTIMTGEVMKFTELQETKRTSINAQKEVAIQQIEATTKLLSDYLEKSFDERSDLFQQYFKAIDVAIANGDMQMLSLSLNSMNDLAKSSPFKDLADINTVQTNLLDKDTEWDI